jgi:hypothetical protein
MSSVPNSVNSLVSLSAAGAAHVEQHRGLA